MTKLRDLMNQNCTYMSFLCKKKLSTALFSRRQPVWSANTEYICVLNSDRANNNRLTQAERVRLPLLLQYPWVVSCENFCTLPTSPFYSNDWRSRSVNVRTRHIWFDTERLHSARLYCSITLLIVTWIWAAGNFENSCSVLIQTAASHCWIRNFFAQIRP